MSFKDRISVSISNTPGTGSVILNTAQSGYLSFSAGDNGLTFDILFSDGTNWELAKNCIYTHSGTSLSRGTFVNSSTGSAISLSSATIVSNVLLAQRMSTSADIFSNTYYGGL